MFATFLRRYGPSHAGDGGNAARIVDRILSQADGIRAFTGPGAGFTIETVTAGTQATLAGTKGAVVLGPVVGLAPAPLRAAGGALGSTALATQPDLVTAIADAYQIATAPIATATVTLAADGPLTTDRRVLALIAAELRALVRRPASGRSASRTRRR